ncbi:MAG: CBS domain-containing protein [Saprospiraceae bacterium]
MEKGALIKEIMTAELVTAVKDETIESVKNKLQINRIHHIPVVHGKHIVGMISLSDIHMMEHHFTLFHSKLAEEINRKIFSTILAKEIMTSQVIKVREDEQLTVAVDLFKENVVHALPVVNKSGKLVGILTPMDLVRYAYDNKKLI